MSGKESVDKNNLPRHVAIIMDGNGRWARQQGNERVFGHRNGVTAVREVTEACAELGIKYLTLYAFSTENWNRPDYEVEALMSLLVYTIDQEMSTLMDNNVCLQAIGDLSALPPDVREKLTQAIAQTSGNQGLKLVLALSYSARWEIVGAVKAITEKVLRGEMTTKDIDNETFSAHLTTKEMPDPELLIRTSGEYRISNFLLWQIAYTELYFSPKMWPEFTRDDLYEALCNYQKRERRFGKTGDQVHLQQNDSEPA